MAYAAWSVVAGEQPTAAKWNILGTNDASFNDGTGIGTAVITYAKLLTTIFSGQVSTQANAGTAGGTMYYINLGGIKLCWGLTGSLSVSGTGVASTGYGITWPTSFFSTIQFAGVFAGAGAASNTQYANPTNNGAVSTTAISFYFSQWSGTNATTSNAGFLGIGT